MGDFIIGDRKVGFDAPLYFIADIAANHDGDINRAYQLIALAKEAGACAAKFQNFKASKIVSKKGFDDLNIQLSHQAGWKKSVFEVYEDASLSYDWTAKLKEKCDAFGIHYMTSPYDFESVDHVLPYVEAFKIGSGDVTWHEIIEYIAGKEKPVIIATGASTLDEVKMAMGILLTKTKDVVLMQCNTNYTAHPDNFKYINLNALTTYREMYPNTVLGLSDHTHGHATILGAIALGARVFEKHFTDDNNREGPDHKFAMNPRTWREMVDRANELYSAMGDGKKKIEANEKETAIVQRRGLRYTRNLGAGHVLKDDDLFPLRPMSENSIPPHEKKKLLGMRLVRDVKVDAYIRLEDVES